MTIVISEKLLSLLLGSFVGAFVGGLIAAFVPTPKPIKRLVAWWFARCGA